MFTRDLNTSNDDEARQQISAVLLQSQIIHAALIVGSLILTTVLTTISFSQTNAKGPQRNQEKQEVEVEPPATLNTMAAGAAVLGLLGSIAVPMIQRNATIAKLEQAGRSNTSNERSATETSQTLKQLLQIYQTSHILGMAILESCTLLSAATLLLGASLWVLAFPAFLILAMVVRTPLRSNIELWIEDQLRRLDAL